MTGSIFTVEEKLTEYQALAAELSSLQWRTAAVLFGSTFLLIFWFGSALDLVFKSGLHGYSPRLLLPVPMALNMTAWVFWVLPEYVPLMGREYRSGLRQVESALLEKIESVQYRLFRLNRTYRLLCVCVAFQFIVMATLMGTISISFGFR